MKLNKGNKRGISLIVLVITIAVMIILAAAIILSLNSSGIIGKANKAKADSDAANLLQAANVAAAEWNLKYKLGETTDDAKTYITNSLESQNFTEEQIAKLGITESGEVKILNYTMYSDGTDEAPIPDGFVVSPYAGEQKISDGLVIYEATAEELEGKTNVQAMETYNQYVWVPVEGEFKLINWSNYSNFETVYVEPLRAGIPHMDDISKYADEISQYNSMKTSVEKNGGFYIARYEAGKEIINSIETVVSKKGAVVWNNIAWDSTFNRRGYGVDTNDGAAKVSKKSYSSVERHLIYGVQWDATMYFMKDVDNPYSTTGKKYIYDSTGMGWYTDNKSGNADHKTGIDVDTKASNKGKNIYDMAGNVFEWTYEAQGSAGNSDSSRLIRGGYYHFCEGSSKPASFRSGCNQNGAGDYYGFRCVLYIK